MKLFQTIGTFGTTCIVAQKTEINEDVITVSLNVEELGDSIRDADTEKNQLHNFVRYIEYSQIDFSGNLKLSDTGIPVIVTDEPDGSTIEKVTISDLVNKKYTLDENLSITLSIDINKIPTASLGTVFNTPEKLGQAMAVLFLEKVKAAITTKLTEIRALANDFEAETSVVL